MANVEKDGIRVYLSRKETERIILACEETIKLIRDETLDADPYEAAQHREVIQEYEALAQRAQWWRGLIESERRG